jgi:hypothetical protein
MEDKCTQSAVKTEQSIRQNGRMNGARKDVRLTGLNKRKGTCLKQAPF